MAFDDSVDEYAQWTVVMPSDWNAGTVTATFYWTTATAPGANNTVRWGFQGRSYADSDAIDQAWAGPQIIDDDVLGADDVMISGATPSVTIQGGPAANELVQFRAYREGTNAADDMTGDARLIAIRVDYTRT